MVLKNQSDGTSQLWSKILIVLKFSGGVPYFLLKKNRNNQAFSDDTAKTQFDDPMAKIIRIKATVVCDLLI